MAKSSPKLPALSDAQSEIMEVVWKQGEVSAADVRMTLMRNGRDVARNTVRTLLERMEEKGWLTHRQHGRTYLYSAAHRREATTGSKVIEVLNDLCGGSPEAMVNALLDYRGLSEAELNRVRDLLDAAKPAAKTKKRGN